MVAGEISLTCDAWQADNTDGYFAVTGHWIEESVPTQWDLKTDLLGFTQLCNAHNGKHLGQALFKIADWIGITHKVNNWSLDHLALTKGCRLGTSLATMHLITPP